MDGDATRASSATTAPDEWPTSTMGSASAAATATTSDASSAIEAGRPVSMSSRYWRRRTRTTRKRDESRAATFAHADSSLEPPWTTRMTGPRPSSTASTRVPSAEVMSASMGAAIR